MIDKKSHWAIKPIILSILVWAIASAQAKQLEVAVGWSKPPYVIPSGNTGFELDLISAVFKEMGHTIVPIYVPYGRSYEMLSHNMVDLTLTINERSGIDEKYLSKVYVVYQNVAISLKKNHVKLDTLTDLSELTIVAFQKATVVLGKEFADVVQSSPLYIELPNQARQVEMLLMGNADVVVMDVNIFNHLLQNFVGINAAPEVEVHSLFPSSPYRAGFKDEALKIQFDVRLTEYRQTKAYIDLLKKYGFFQPPPESSE